MDSERRAIIHESILNSVRNSGAVSQALRSGMTEMSFTPSKIMLISRRGETGSIAMRPCPSDLFSPTFESY